MNYALWLTLKNIINYRRMIEIKFIEEFNKNFVQLIS